MSKTIHFYHGCPWANGEIQQADTEQVTDWNKVTCKHCIRRKRLAHRAAEHTNIKKESKCTH